MDKAFNLYSKYYDLLYADKDYNAETEYIAAVIDKYRPDASNIIEFGSGTGKHANLLAGKGYKILGIEPSNTMIAIAKEAKNARVNFQQASFLTFDTQEMFDVALSLFHVVSYINNNDELIGSFNKVNYILKERGLFIFDVWYTPAVLTSLPEKRVKKIEKENISIIRNASPVMHWNENIVDVNYEIKIKDSESLKEQVVSEKHSMRHFSIPEIDLLARTTGFKVLAAEEFGSGNKPSASTWGITFILEKTTKN